MIWRGKKGTIFYFILIFQVCQIKPSTMYFTQSKMSGLESAGQERLVSVTQVSLIKLLEPHPIK